MSLPKATEMTIRNFLMKELEKRNIKVNTEISYKTPIGRLMPDLLLCNGAEYVVETKLGAEAKLLDAMVQLYDYSKYTQTNGGFAVLFPKELRSSWGIEIIEKIVSDPKLKYIAAATFKDARPSQRFVGNLSEMADWIATHVLKRPLVEADTNFAIKVLTEAVEYLTTSLRVLKDKELEDIFGGKTVFENILQYEEGHYPIDEMRQATTYLLANQIIFYHVLSRMDMAFESIDEDKISKPNDLLNYFNPVLKKDYSSIFGFDVASRLPEAATKTLKRVIMAVKALAPEKIGHDVLGKVFHELIPFNVRKKVAAFYTKNEAAEILAQLSIDNPEAKVMDLAVGSGTLLVAAYRRKRELKKKTGSFDLSKDHSTFLEKDLTGIDIMPFAAHLAVMHLSLQALLSETNKVRIAVWDSTGLDANMQIPAIDTELKAAYKRPTLDMFRDGSSFKRDAYVKKGAITLNGIGQGEKIPLEKVDTIIMNPPFTRQERLPKEYKKKLIKNLGEYSEHLHGQLGLHSFFIFLADKFLKPKGKMALVLPASILRVKSNLGLRNWLSENYNLDYIITSRNKLAFSESSWFGEILLIATKKSKESKEKPCNIVVIKEMPDDLKISSNLGKEIRNNTLGSINDAYETDNLLISAINQDELKESVGNWFTFISTYNPNIRKLWRSIAQKKLDNKLITFGNYLTKSNLEIVRGIETRSKNDVPIQMVSIANATKTLSRKAYQWILESISKKELTVENRYSKVKVKIPKKAYLPALITYAKKELMDISEETDFVVIGNFIESINFFPIEKRKRILSLLGKWKRYVKSRMGNIFICRRYVPFAKGTIHTCYYSETLLAPSGTMWVLRQPNTKEAKIIALWMNSSLHLLQILLQKIEDIWIDVHKYVLDDYLIINPEILTEIEKKVLLKIFDDISTQQFPSLTTQIKERHVLRHKIDKTFLSILNLNDEEINGFIDALYSSLVNEIEELENL